MQQSLRLLIPHQWSRAVADAEKLVGYTGSFLSLQCLLTDEIAQLALNARKLVSRQQHPLFKTAKYTLHLWLWNLLHDRTNIIQTWGLTVLLVSRAANSSLNCAQSGQPVDGIYSSQRSLAEIVELICTANLIHKGILNQTELSTKCDDVEKSANWDIWRDITLGNKLGVLGGDFLLANSCMALSKLKNTNVVNDVAQGIADMVAGTFLENPKTTEQIKRKLYLSTGSILAHSCRASLKLANHSDKLLEAAFNYGKNLSIAFEVNKLLKRLQEGSAEEVTEKCDEIDQRSLRELAKESSLKAVTELSSYCSSEARNSLKSMAIALSHSK